LLKNALQARGEPATHKRKLLKNFGQLRRKGTLRLGITIPGLFGSSDWDSASKVAAYASGYGLSFALRGLCRVRSKKLIFQRRTIKTTYDRLHFVNGGRFYKRKALGLLRLVITNHFHGICNQILRGQPLFNIIRGDPGGQIT
jgi:hypothetical protein